jgi:glycosyltransferase involved in cell wall biosynthesis
MDRQQIDGIDVQNASIAVSDLVGKCDIKYDLHVEGWGVAYRLLANGNLRRLFNHLVELNSMTNTLTVLIPCKNERRNIRPCVESVEDLAQEILVADSGSTDGTLDLVRSIKGCRVIEREYVNSANFKNWAIPQASGEWILLLDADERLTPSLVQEIRSVLNATSESIDGYSIARLNHYLGHRIKRCGWDTDRVIRLFRRNVSRYAERWVHAELTLDPTRVRTLREPMLHYTTWTTDQYVEKLNRYAYWSALNARGESKRSRALGFISLMTVAPLRFIQLYFIRLGFLDGVPGFQVCMFAAFYSFLKKAKIWEQSYAMEQPDPEALPNMPRIESQSRRRSA